MKKIPRLFLRDDERKILNEVTPGCEWVLNGEGRPTRKYDGTSSALIITSIINFYKRYDNKKEKAIEDDWIHSGDTTERGKNIYWIPITKADKWHQEAIKNFNDFDYDIEFDTLTTFELCGPKVQGNPEKLTKHIFIHHGKTNSEEDKYLLEHNPRTVEEIKKVLSNLDIEGIVWHHEDGRMCKILKKNFGLTRNL